MEEKTGLKNRSMFDPTRIILENVTSDLRSIREHLEKLKEAMTVHGHGNDLYEILEYIQTRIDAYEEDY